jgi:serine/threonine-protein kinase
MTDAHPSFADLVERSNDPEVQEHVASCPKCRVESRLIAEIFDSDSESLPQLGEARERMGRARHEASLSMSRSVLVEPGEEDEDLEVGRVLQRYTVQALVGRGGMGTVYQVRHNQLGSMHALKVLHWVSRTVRNRLMREGQAQSRLRHPNVVNVTDVVDVDGTPGLIMEHVDGPSLSELLRERGRLPLDEVDRLAQGIIRGVDAAHRAGLVHRDLKPANVLLAPGDEGNVPKVADFGLARLAETGAGDPRLTRSDTPMGTPSYMAPEQIRDASTADARSDIFSLGAVLYELAVGRRAFDGLDVVDIYDRIRTGEFTPPDRVVDDLPERMRQTIERALEVDPARRFGDCREMLASWRGSLDPASDWSADPAPGLSDLDEATLVGRRIGSPVRFGAALVLGLVVGIFLVAALLDLLRPDVEVTEPLVVGVAEPEAPSVTTEHRLTARAPEDMIQGMDLSPDGEVLALSDARGLWLQPAGRGEPELLIEGSFHHPQFFPDGKRLLAQGKVGERKGSWLVHPDGTAELLLERGGSHASLSPDGQKLAIVDETGLWVLPIDGSPATRIRSLGDWDTVLAIAWSPSGTHVAAAYESVSLPDAWIEIMAADGSTSRRALESFELAHFRGATLTWVPPDRLLFGFVHERAQPYVVALRAVEDATTAPVSDFEQAPTIHRWTGILPTCMQASADGNRVAYIGVEVEKDTWLLPLDGSESARVLTREAWSETPTGWTSSGDVLLVSDRSSSGRTGKIDFAGDLYAQPLDGSPPTLLARGPVLDFGADVVGDDLVFTRILRDEEGEAVARAVIRQAPGGSEEELARFEAPANLSFLFEARCSDAAAAKCAVSEPVGTGARFSLVDLNTGERTEPLLASTFVWRGWNLSPDGRTLAIAKAHPYRIVFHDLVDETEIERSIDKGKYSYLAWAPTGDKVYLTGATWDEEGYKHSLVAMDLEGNQEILWTSETTYLSAPTPSPDGRYVAFGGIAYDDDVWLLDGLAGRDRSETDGVREELERQRREMEETRRQMEIEKRAVEREER